MKVNRLGIEGLFLIESDVYSDDRGYFLELFNEKKFAELELPSGFAQDNLSVSKKNVIRGLHFQDEPHAQGKLVRVIRGAALDVAVDIRKGSSTYGKSFSTELSGSNNKQLFIPKGFAHGFSVLSEKAVVMYKCDAFYNKESEGGIIYNDPSLNIDWKIPADKAIISEKDDQLPALKDCRNNFAFEK